MQMISAAMKIGLREWVRGCVGAAISGGAGSIASGVGATALDKSHDLNIIALMGITFVVSGIISLGKYLEIHPLPEDK